MVDSSNEHTGSECGDAEPQTRPPAGRNIARALQHHDGQHVEQKRVEHPIYQTEPYEGPGEVSTSGRRRAGLLGDRNGEENADTEPHEHADRPATPQPLREGSTVPVHEEDQHPTTGQQVYQHQEVAREAQLAGEQA
jgi:hypothetical protein